MEKTKITSVRIETETLKMIDDFCAKHTYLSRSSVINRVLSAAMKCCDNASFWRLMESFDPYGDGLKVIIIKKTC